MPTNEQGLQALVTMPTIEPRPASWREFFKEVPKDPWNNPYVYRNPGKKNSNSYDIFSAGPDGKPDTSDDDFGGE